MQRDLIVFGEDWGGLPSSTQHLIQRLAAKRRVIWVNSIGLRQPKINIKDLKRAWHKLTLSANSAVEAKPQATDALPNNFVVVNPKTLPAPRTWLGRKIAARILSAQLRPIIAEYQLNDPILWTSLPTAVDMHDTLGTSSLVYYCGDDFSTLAGVDHKTVAAREKELVKKADLILAASETLERQLSSQQTRLLPHGVDYSLFAKPMSRALDFPDNGKPCAGFYGWLSEWLDYDLLHKVIIKMPDWQFIFIGETCDEAKTLAIHPNVLLLGPRPHHQLPSYSQHWAASLLPFRDNGQIRACNPLKLREYLAAGRPIISTPFPAVRNYAQHVSLVTDADQMVDALESARYQTVNFAQQQAVQPHTWDARATQLNQWLESL